MKKLLVLCSLVVMLLGLTAFSATAAFMNGGISFSGTYTLDTGSISTSNAFATFSSVVISSGSGIWAPVTPGTSATFTPFTFNPTNNVTPLWSFTFGGVTYSLDALASTMLAVKTGGILPTLTVTGTGTAHASAGYADTPGAYVITANESQTTFSFSSSSGVAPVPEPGTVILLGSSLLGIVVVGRKKFRM